MNWFISALITGTIAFSATNIDDIVFLTVFFSQARHRWHVVIGQYLGFTGLVLVSLVGFLGGQILPYDWLRWFGIAPMAIGIKKLFDKRDAESQRAGTGMFSVAAVTFSNGSDNIGIYAPLFAVSDSRHLIVLVGVLYVLLAVWCAIGYLIDQNRTVAYALKRWGYWIVPVILIGLGIYILSS